MFSVYYCICGYSADDEDRSDRDIEVEVADESDFAEGTAEAPAAE